MSFDEQKFKFWCTPVLQCFPFWFVHFVLKKCHCIPQDHEDILLCYYFLETCFSFHIYTHNLPAINFFKMAWSRLQQIFFSSILDIQFILPHLIKTLSFHHFSAVPILSHIKHPRVFESVSVPSILFQLSVLAPVLHIMYFSAIIRLAIW